MADPDEWMDREVDEELGESWDIIHPTPSLVARSTAAPPVLELTTRGGAAKLYLRTANADEAEHWLAAVQTAIHGVSYLNF